MRASTVGRRHVLFGAAALTFAMPRISRAQDGNPPVPAEAGQLLVASDGLTDPRFVQTVILLAQHDDGGAVGLVLNHPVEDRTLASLLDAIGEDSSGVNGSVRVFDGGPVSHTEGFVLHTADYRIDDTLPIDVALSLTSDPQILRDMGTDKGPLKSFVAFGYAGWGPGQLESEIDAGGWIVAAPDVKLVFDDDRDGLWQEAMTRRVVPL